MFTVLIVVSFPPLLKHDFLLAFCHSRQVILAVYTYTAQVYNKLLEKQENLTKECVTFGCH